MDKSKRRIRRLNDRKYKNHIKYLSDIKYGCYIAPAYYYTGKPRDSRNDKNCYKFAAKTHMLACGMKAASL